MKAISRRTRLHGRRRGSTKSIVRRRLSALAALTIGVSIAAPIIAIATAPASSAATQDKVIYVQKSGSNQTSAPYVEYEGANGTNVTQSLTVSRATCNDASTLSNPASSVLPLSAVYYPNGYSKASTAATVATENNSDVGETGVCVNSRTSPGETIEPNEGLVFSAGQVSSSLTYGRLFSQATIPLKNNDTDSSVAGNLVLRRMESGVETTVDTVPFSIAAGRESTGDTNDCPVVSTGVVPAADQFDQLEIQVTSSRGTVSVIGPSCDNDNDKDDAAVPTYYLDAAPTITSANNATFTAGSNGSFSVTTAGYPTPTLTNVAFPSTSPTCTPSTLPTGLSFTDNGNGTATIAGTPAPTANATAGPYTYTFCINAANAAGTATQTFTLTVDQGAAITSANAATFTAGSPGVFTVTTTGFPTPSISDTCSVSLPQGVTFTDNGNGTATIQGTPSAITANNPNGTYTFPVCISASNTFGGSTNTATQSFTLTVDQAPAFTSGDAASFTSGSSDGMSPGQFGSFTVTTTGNPTPAITNAAFEGCNPTTLPSGVTLVDNGNGTATISGTPAQGSGGTYTLCLNATNAFGSPSTTYTATQQFTLTVDQAPAITSLDNVIVPVSQPFTFTVTTTGYPIPAITNAAFEGCTPSTLPSSVTLVDNGDGTATLSGTPAATDGGTYTICLNAENGSGTATQAFTLVITSPSQPLTATNNSTSGVTATLQVNSGSKSFTDFTTSDAGGDGTEASVVFTTEGSSTYTASLNINWGNRAYCVPYASTTPPTCQPTTVTIGDEGATPEPVLACPNGSPPAAPPSPPLPTTWCSEGATYSYVNIGGTEYTNITETIFGSGDLTFNHG